MIQIRHARLTDINRLVEIENSCFDKAKYGSLISARQFGLLLRKKSSAVLVAIAEDEIAGYAALRFVFRGGLTWFYSLAVARRYQGKGVGVQIFRSAEVEAQRMCCPCMILDVREDNKALLWRYSRYGYSIMEKNQSYYPDGSSSFRMSKRLTDKIDTSK